MDIEHFYYKGNTGASKNKRISCSAVLQ